MRVGNTESVIVWESANVGTGLDNILVVPTNAMIGNITSLAYGAVVNLSGGVIGQHLLLINKMSSGFTASVVLYPNGTLTGDSTRFIYSQSPTYQNVVLSNDQSILLQKRTDGYWNVLGTTGGFQGLVGPQGYQGDQGSQGAGLQGADRGQTGETGFDGPIGVVGEQGQPGMIGNIGAQGAQGAQGSQGDQGAQGSQGSIGTQGAQGLQGTAGANGGPGIPGDQGFQGPDGPQGPDGLPC